MSPVIGKQDADHDSVIVRLNTAIRGEPAQIVLDLKRRGIVRSNTEAFVQGVYALQKIIVERDLALAKLRTLSSDVQS